MGPDRVRARYGIPAANYADFAVLRGDPSDGLPGVPGIGEKTAAALVARFGSIEDILAATERGDSGFPAGAAAKVRAARAYLARAPGAVRLREDAPVFEVDDALPRTPRDGDQLSRLATDLGVEPSVQRLQAAVRAALAATG
jgi:5'-3' exonuclease